jgi:ketosteroid isomerase-like protein
VSGGNVARPNVEIVRSIYAGWSQGDYSSVEWADPDIEFVSIFDQAESRGVEALGKRWREVLGAYADLAVLPEEFIDRGEQVLVLVRFRGRGRGSGAPVTDFRGANLFTLRDGKVVRLVLYSDRAEALEAAELRE